MDSISGEGRTVLFVSHNLQAVRVLCRRSILLSEGNIIIDASTADTLHEYYKHLRKMEVDANTDVINPKNRRGSGAVRFTNIRIEDESGKECNRFIMGSTIRFKLAYQVFDTVDRLFLGILLRSGKSREIVTSVRYLVYDGRLYAGYTNSVVIEFPNVNLRPGEYPIYIWCVNHKNRSLDVVDDLTSPLLIYTEKEFDELGFDPSRDAGFFNIHSNIVQL